MCVTIKGQVTTPKDVRDKLGIVPGSDVGFAEEGGQFVLINESTQEARQAAEATAWCMADRTVAFGKTAKRIAMTDTELMELTRGPFNHLDAD
jgi:AbrB family looped-hinge helix DNA binding protein